VIDDESIVSLATAASSGAIHHPVGNWRREHPVENGSFPDHSLDWMDTP